MDAATAEIRLKRMIAWDQSPALDQSAVDDLLVIHASLNTAGDTVYDLAAAAVEGWRWKAALAASAITFSSDGQSINRDQYIKHCAQMIEQYASGAAFSLATSARVS